MVLFYSIREVEEKDLNLNPGLEVGDVDWVLSNESYNDFIKNHCTEDEEFDSYYDDIKEAYPEKFSQDGVSADVYNLAVEYSKLNLNTLIKVDAIPDISDANVLDVNSLPAVVREALRKQKDEKYKNEIKEKFPELYNKGITQWPMFIYGTDKKDNILLLIVSVVNGKLTLEKKTASRLSLIIVAKSILTKMKKSIDSGEYTPTDNIRSEIDEVQKRDCEKLGGEEMKEICNRIGLIYSNFENITFFGTDYDYDYDDYLEENFDYPSENLDYSSAVSYTHLTLPTNREV